MEQDYCYLTFPYLSPIARNKESSLQPTESISHSAKKRLFPVMNWSQFQNYIHFTGWKLYINVYNCRAAIKGRNLWHLSWLSTLDFPLIVRVKLPVVNRIQPQSNRFATGVENEATGDSKLNDSPATVSQRFISKPSEHNFRNTVIYIHV